MTTFIIKRQKLFFEYGLTSADISNYAKTNNMNVKDAYSALKDQKAKAGVGAEAYNSLDKSAYKASTIKAGSDSTGIVGKSAGGQFLAPQGKASAARAGQAGTAFNKGYYAGTQAAGKKMNLPGANPKINWGKVGKGALIVGGTYLAGKALFGNKKEKEKTYSIKRICQK